MKKSADTLQRALATIEGCSGFTLIAHSSQPDGIAYIIIEHDAAHTRGHLEYADAIVTVRTLNSIEDGRAGGIGRDGLERDEE